MSVVDWYRQQQAVEADRKLMREAESEEPEDSGPKFIESAAFPAGYQSRRARRAADKREGAIRNLRQGLKRGGWQVGRGRRGMSWLHPNLQTRREGDHWRFEDTTQVPRDTKADNGEA